MLVQVKVLHLAEPFDVGRVARVGLLLVHFKFDLFQTGLERQLIVNDDVRAHVPFGAQVLLPERLGLVRRLPVPHNIRTPIIQLSSRGKLI